MARARKARSPSPLARTPLRVVELFNDRESYFLTFQQWARNLDHNREMVIARFGDSTIVGSAFISGAPPTNS